MSPRVPVGSLPSHLGSLPVIRRFGRYTAVEEIGRGGMGVVYRAWDPLLKRWVAVKQMLPGGREIGKYHERFLREATSLAALRHPNIVPIYAVAPEEPGPYLVLSLIEGRSLNDLLRESIPLRRGVRWIVNLARALEHAHERGIVHRDIKPSNILIRRDRRPCLIDFGLARESFERGRDGFTRAGAFLGTPLYMSPEQALGRPADAASDQYALGLVFYEVLTGRYPFGRVDSKISLLFDRIEGAPPPPPSTIVPGIPRALDEICRRALAPTSAGRYPDLGAMARDLERQLRSIPARRPIRRRVRPVGALRQRLRLAARRVFVGWTAGGTVEGLVVRSV